ncbi:MAG: TatD family hydrolase, partial [Vallitaleaceae bacterium]|nr:TatD family hydrolase [Vallitaleaceae bacterium]
SVQKLWFREQLRLAKDLDMPVIIHSRDACQDTFDILTEEEHSPKKAVIHCFSGSKEMALEYVKRGYFIGIGGVVTFSNAKKLVEVTKEIPLSHILVETDAPYLTPNPHRGKRNDSKYLVDIIKEIAAIKNISPQEVEDVTYENGKRFFFPEE